MASASHITAFFRRHLALIVGVGTLVAFWMLVYTFAVYKPSYAAKATVIIKDSAITSRYVEPEQYYAMQTTSSSSSNPVLNTMGILKSHDIGDALYEYFKTTHQEQLKKNKIATKADWDSFYQDGTAFIKAKNQPGTDLIAIQFSWSNPMIARDGLEVVVKAFQEASRDLNKEEQISRTKFLKKQVIEIEHQLAEIRHQKSEYQGRTRTVSVQREGSDLAGTRMELTNRLSQIEAQARGKENVVARYQQMLGMTPEKALRGAAMGQNGTLARLQDELYRLEQQYSQLNSSLTETNPKVLEIKAQMDQVRANIASEKVRTMGLDLKDAEGEEVSVVADSTRGTMVSGMMTAQAEAQDLRAQASVLRNRLAQVDGQIQRFPGVAEDMTNIEQKEAALSTALDHLRQKVMEGGLKEEQTLSNVFIVDSPRLPEKGQFPTRLHLIVLSLLMGLGAGVAVAFAKEQFFMPQADGMLPTWMEPLDNEDEDVMAQQPMTAQARLAAKTIPAVRYPLHQQSGLYMPQAPLQQAQQQVAQQALAPVVEQKVEAPTVGSLFDTLMPVAGPLLNQQKRPVQAEALKPLQNGNGRASEKPAASIPVSANGNGKLREDLLPPPISESPVAPAPMTLAWEEEAEAPAQSKPRVRVLNVADIKPQAQPAMRSPERAVTVPVLHAAPVSDQPDSLPLMAREEAQSMPFPKRRRSLPAFLLGDESLVTAEEEIRPAQSPRKQLLAPDEDLMQEVSPMDAPAAAMPEVESVPVVEPSVEEQRSPLRVSSIWFRKKPERHPDVYFPMSSRGKQRETELPSSLARSMSAFEQTR